jgi:hypothetical protein
MMFGHYEFTILPFGLTKSPGVFMSLMNGVFCEYLDKFFQVFIDDILIYSQMTKEHDENLHLVLQVFARQQIIRETVEMFFLSIKDSLFGACYLR